MEFEIILLLIGSAVNLGISIAIIVGFADFYSEMLDEIRELRKEISGKREQGNELCADNYTIDDYNECTAWKINESCNDCSLAKTPSYYKKKGANRKFVEHKDNVKEHK